MKSTLAATSDYCGRPVKLPAILRRVECFCHCGTKVPRGLTEVNLRAGELALELLAWDKARATDPSSSDAATAARVIPDGIRCFQGLLSAIHGDRDSGSLGRAEEWLQLSRDERRSRSQMTDKGSLLSPGKLRLTDQDIEQIDRKRPDLSFTGDRDEPEPEPERERVDEDPVAQLKGLRELHEAGALTDEEFAAAKARVISRL